MMGERRKRGGKYKSCFSPSKHQFLPEQSKQTSPRSGPCLLPRSASLPQPLQHAPPSYSIPTPRSVPPFIPILCSPAFSLSWPQLPFRAPLGPGFEEHTQPRRLACTCCPLRFGRLSSPTLAGIAATARQITALLRLSPPPIQQRGKRSRPSSRLSSGRPGGIILVCVWHPAVPYHHRRCVCLQRCGPPQ